MSNGESPTTVMIVAGETSGDMHGAALVRAIRARVNLHLIGIGGRRLIAEGLNPLLDASRMNVSGFAEIVRHYRFLRQAFTRTVDLARESRPALAILVDYPGFNLRLARELHAMSIPVVYYIAPQVWAWRERRVEQLRRNVDTMIVAFPFEVEYFAAHGIAAHFFGHPLVDAMSRMPREAPSFVESERTIAYLPGSRPHEVRRHMPLIVSVMRELGDAFNHVVVLAPTVSRDAVTPYQSRVPFAIVDDARRALGEADAALVKAGTSTVEAAIIGTPFAAYYLTSWISYQIARRAIKVAWIAMVNILAGRAVVREFVQGDAKPRAMAIELRRLCNDEAYRARMIAELALVREALGEPGGADRAAAFIVARHLQ